MREGSTDDGPALIRPRGGLGGRVAASGLALALAACAPAAPQTPPSRDSALAATLVELGERALAAGEPESARDRFDRALAADPESVDARSGLGRAALAAGRQDEARQALDAALERDPGHVATLLGLAQLAGATGEGGRARALLERARAADPNRPEVHEALARLTGRAASPGPVALEASLARAARHPYDPRARLDAARALARTQRSEEARRLLETGLWIADLDPAATREALELLARLDPAWREQIAVPVHVFADEGVRTDPAWRFRLRLLWHGLTVSLQPVLGVHFLPVRITPCETSAAPPDLASLARSCLAGRPRPAAGIVGIFTGRPAPRRGKGWKLGQAEFLGRQLVVRLAPGATESRVLAHEAIHLYGGVHVSPQTDALMNPSGESRALDPWNRDILAALRARRFGPGGHDENVLPWIDLDATRAAYQEALRANLAFRRLGILEAWEAGRESRFLAARRAREAVELDDHLGDVAHFLAWLAVHDDRPASAAVLLETAARLWGPRTPRGRDALRNARILEQRATR